MNIQTTSNLHHPVQTATKLDRSCIQNRFTSIDEKKEESHAGQEPVLYRPVTRSNMKRSDLLVVLDMDHTIIHSTSFEHPGEIRAVKGIESFNFRTESGLRFNTRLRPGLHEFLRNLALRFHVHIFTAGTPVYADPLLDALEGFQPGMYFQKRWYRSDCTEDEYGEHFKDLSRITSDLRRVVLVDDLITNFRGQPENGILIDPFVGTWEFDAPPYLPLARLWKHLLLLDTLPDVRPHIRDIYNHAKNLDDLASEYDSDDDELDTVFDGKGERVGGSDEKSSRQDTNNCGKYATNYLNEQNSEVCDHAVEPLPDDEDCDLDDVHEHSFGTLSWASLALAVSAIVRL